MLDRRLLKNFDYQLLLFMLLISIYGLLVLSSATQGISSNDPLFYVRKQAVWLSIGAGIMMLIISINYLHFYHWSWYLYAVNILFLGMVLFIGKEGLGAYRWIDLKVFDFQPSELAKVIVIITLARLLVDFGEKTESFTAVLPFLLHVFFPMLLVFLQPDLGTALVFIAIFFGMLYMAGIPWKNLLILAGVGLALSPLLWMRLHDYQKLRLLVFLNPELDPLRYGYQLKQSMIAVGSGGLAGKGLYQGSQARLQFLPAQHTDFIFSVLGEECGFLGALLLLLLYFFLIYRIFRIGSLAKDKFGALICTGVATMMLFQILVNVGMVLSIMPVTGLPLPFLSYGGNSLLVNFISIGIVLSIGMRRHKIQF
ncbi:MAG: rod shape-determining protein RodA [Firmicutes bacterium]|nr:rod shape-determining protein RodA [Bacillota bacterium]